MCPLPLTLTRADLAAMPREQAEVTEQDGTKSTYEGVPLQEVLKKAGISFGKQIQGKGLAGYVLAEAKDGYQVVFAHGRARTRPGRREDSRRGQAQRQGAIRISGAVAAGRARG